jgi:hypothetical protein
MLSVISDYIAASGTIILTANLKELEVSGHSVGPCHSSGG